MTADSENSVTQWIGDLRTGNREEAKKQLQLVVAARGDFKEKAEARKVLDELSNGS